MKIISILFLGLAAMAQDKPAAKPAADPITDKQRFEYSQIQKALLLAQAQARQADADFKAALDQLKTKYQEINAACAKDKRVFDETAFVCVAPPPKAEEPKK